MQEIIRLHSPKLIYSSTNWNKLKTQPSSWQNQTEMKKRKPSLFLNASIKKLFHPTSSKSPPNKRPPPKRPTTLSPPISTLIFIWMFMFPLWTKSSIERIFSSAKSVSYWTSLRTIHSWKTFSHRLCRPVTNKSITSSSTWLSYFWTNSNQRFSIVKPYKTTRKAWRSSWKTINSSTKFSSISESNISIVDKFALRFQIKNWSKL